MESYNPKEIISVESPVLSIECKEAFDLLEEKEKKYCYYFSKACWSGYRTCFFERSYESPALYILIRILFAGNMKKTKLKLTQEGGFTEGEWKQLVVYCAAVLANAGNFKSFGDTKFVPEIPEEKFKSAIIHSCFYSEYKEVLDNIWERISKEVYSEEAPYFKIGFYENSDSSSYYSSNITKPEIELVSKFISEKAEFKHLVSPINTRLLKNSDGSFELRIHSTKRAFEGSEYLKEYTFEGVKISVANGDLDFIFEEMVKNLQFAKFYAANERQIKILDNYIAHFTTGQESYFREAMMEWVQDKDPSIEFEVGFQETYLDPSGSRAEYEGL